MNHRYNTIWVQWEYVSVSTKWFQLTLFGNKDVLWKFKHPVILVPILFVFFFPFSKFASWSTPKCNLSTPGGNQIICWKIYKLPFLEIQLHWKKNPFNTPYTIDETNCQLLRDVCAFNSRRFLKSTAAQPNGYSINYRCFGSSRKRNIEPILLVHNSTFSYTIFNQIRFLRWITTKKIMDLASLEFVSVPNGIVSKRILLTSCLTYWIF